MQSRQSDADPDPQHYFWPIFLLLQLGFLLFMSQRVDPLNQTTPFCFFYKEKQPPLQKDVQYTVSQFSKAFSSVELFKYIFCFFNWIRLLCSYFIVKKT